MQPRFVGRLGLADVVTVSNAALGFLAAAVAMVDPALAARLILLAAVADGLDGVIARKMGGTPVGDYLDSLADVASFGVAPALFVVSVANAQWGLVLGDLSPRGIAALALPALFVAAAVIRLGLYTAYDVAKNTTEGVQSTLAGTILAVVYLAGFQHATLLVALAGLFAYLMVTTIQYPELYARDAIAMGVIQALAILAPLTLDRIFPKALLVAAVAYLVLAPRFYWR
ncbi:protein sorting system archaetidylserine synthase [Haladaptatus sp. ZSTT2]|uniref:protein sorting system archaetidylserine synthase n=1 Tax=Haladaptatus sp. ZSTT2 TaxID=3120515 RepID=UPI00300F1204